MQVSYSSIRGKRKYEPLVSLVHIHRLIYDYGNYTLDISGPLMINTQKLTAIAFAFYDGYRSTQWAKRQRSNEDNDYSPLNEDQEKQKIVGIPNPIEYLSYIFYFHGICIGPLCFFKDYRDFIEGCNLLVVPTSETTDASFNQKSYPLTIEQPCTMRPVLTKLGQCIILGYVLIVYTPHYPIEYNLSEEMINSPLLKRLSFLLFSTFCTRIRYAYMHILQKKTKNYFNRFYFSQILFCIYFGGSC